VVKFARKTNPRILTAKTRRPRRSRIQVVFLVFLVFLSELSVFAVRMPLNGKDREEAEYKLGSLGFHYALSVFAVRMLWFKKHIQQQEN